MSNLLICLGNLNRGNAAVGATRWFHGRRPSRSSSSMGSSGSGTASAPSQAQTPGGFNALELQVDDRVPERRAVSRRLARCMQWPEVDFRSWRGRMDGTCCRASSSKTFLKNERRPDDFEEIGDRHEQAVADGATNRSRPIGNFRAAQYPNPKGPDHVPRCCRKRVAG
jgi:hypothetical protein